MLPGVIVLNSGDSLRGHKDVERNTENAGGCWFRYPDNNSRPKKYYPTELKSYRIDNSKYYVSRDIKMEEGSISRYVFLEYLVKGYANLYYYRNGGTDIFFLEKDGELIELSNDERRVAGQGGKEYVAKSNRHVGVMKYAFSDAPQIFDEVNNTEFEYKSMVRVTKKYHNAVCHVYACIDYTKNTKAQHWIEPMGG